MLDYGIESYVSAKRHIVLLFKYVTQEVNSLRAMTFTRGKLRRFFTVSA